MSAQLFISEFNAKRRHRVHQWIDKAKLEPMFGIQEHVAKGVWAHVAPGGKVLLYGSFEEAKEQISARAA